MNPRLQVVVSCSLLGLGACSPSPASSRGAAVLEAGTSAETSRLEALAATALAEGNSRLALNLSRKAARAGQPSLSGVLTAARAAARTGDQGRAAGWLEEALDLGFTDGEWLDSLPELAPIRSDPAYPRLRRRLEANLQGKPLPVGVGLAQSTPELAGLHPAALARLIADAEKTQSAALVLLKDGQLVGEWYFGDSSHRIETMSATKAVVSLAIGLLLQEGTLPSLDTPVSRFFPEWVGRPNQAITVRQLLNHTSGLTANRIALEIYASRDIEKNALEAGLSSPPGIRFFYNNKATNLLAALVRRASGSPIDVFLEQRLFGPLRITDYSWQQDPKGARYGMAGLRLHPVDFAKLGQLVLQRGVWEGRQLLDRAWIDQSALTAGQPFDPSSALLWWRIPRSHQVRLDAGFFARLQKHELPTQLLQRLEPLRGRTLEVGQFGEELQQRLRPFQQRQLGRAMRQEGLETFTERSAELAGFAAKGSLGNFLFVMPEAGLVAVRMCEAQVDQLHPGDVDFPHFFDRVRALAEAAPAPDSPFEGLDGAQP